MCLFKRANVMRVFTGVRKSPKNRKKSKKKRVKLSERRRLLKFASFFYMRSVINACYALSYQIVRAQSHAFVPQPVSSMFITSRIICNSFETIFHNYISFIHRIIASLERKRFSILYASHILSSLSFSHTQHTQCRAIFS